jgi:hypothetical protein
LKITGRLKEIFKTSKGKYVAPAPIENKLNVHPMIEMSIVSGVSQSAAYAMVVLAEDIRPKVKDAEVRAQVEQQLSEFLTKVNSELADYEKLRMLVIASEAWSIENGYLTPNAVALNRLLKAKCLLGMKSPAVCFGLDGWTTQFQTHTQTESWRTPAPSTLSCKPLWAGSRERNWPLPSPELAVLASLKLLRVRPKIAKPKLGRCAN